MDATHGSTAFVTGGTSGIGEAIATGLARHGVEVLLLARDSARADAAVARIRGKVPGARLEVVPGDLASLASVRSAVQQVKGNHPSLNLLVLAAGVFHRQRTETVDGVESTFQVNYLSHFLIANLLAEPLKRGAPSRTVIVASKYGNARIPFDDLMVKRRKFTVMNSVPQTKLAEILLMQELAERWAPAGGVVNALHPGLVAHTHLLTEVGGSWRFMTNLFGTTPEKGADTAVWLATAPETASVTGKFWAKRKPLKLSGQAADPGARQQLWTESLRLVGPVNE